jgi:hypothetical protein
MKHLLFIVTAAIALTNLASAASYKVKIMEKVTVDGKELAPGDYQVDVNDKTAVIRKGKDTTEVKVRTESNTRKYDSTAVRYTKDGGKNNLEEIHIGGTTTKLVFEESKSANGGN